MAVLSRTRYNICYNTLVIGRRDYREILCTLEVERSSAARPRPVQGQDLALPDSSLVSSMLPPSGSEPLCLLEQT